MDEASRVCSPRSHRSWGKDGDFRGWFLLGSLVALPFQEISLSLTPISAPSGGFSAPWTVPWGGGTSRSQAAWQQDPSLCMVKRERFPRKLSAWGARCLEPV